MATDVIGLFVYGTLAPGEANERFLKALSGYWQPATVMGRLYPDGLGASAGYPALDIYEPVESIRGQIFWSAQLAAYWPVLDEFEGEGYRREWVNAQTDTGRVRVYTYAMVNEGNLSR